MLETVVVDINRDTYDLYIGRGSKWGNPFRRGVHGNRHACIARYKNWIVYGDGRHLLADLHELEGRTLGCFCAPDGGVTHETRPWVCHGQVLIALLAHRAKKISERTTA